MIGDLDKGVKHSNVSSFADDTRITSVIKSHADSKNLQEDLNSIISWANNNMRFNSEKFELIRYENNECLKQQPYHANEQEITEKDNLRDLGIHLNNKLTYQEHIDNITMMANQQVGWILRTFRSRKPEHLLPLWKSLVLSRLEYVCQVWAPNKISDIEQIEQTQRVFTRKLNLGVEQDYWKRLKTLKIYSVQRRRERYSIIYTWKILENLVPNPTSQNSVQITGQHHQRFGRTCYRNTLEGVSQRLRSLHACSFTFEGPRLFNCLPRDIRGLTNCSIEVFKRHLDKFLQGVPDEPPIRHAPATRAAASNSLPDQVDYLKRAGGVQ